MLAWPSISCTARRSAPPAKRCVAKLCRELNRRPPEVLAPAQADPNGPPLTIPLDTEEGRLCRQVILYAHYALRAEAPGQADEAVAHLEAEFFAELRAHGTVRLPDPASLEPVEALLAHARAWIAAQAQCPGRSQGRKD
jgi:hypothetical protein